MATSRIYDLASYKIGPVVWWCLPFVLIYNAGEYLYHAGRGIVTSIMPSSSSQFNLTVTPAGVIATVLAAYMAKSAWDNTPTWIKQYLQPTKYIANRSRSMIAKTKDANDDLANPSAIVHKLKDMFDLMYKESDDLLPDDMPWYMLYCCFMSLLHNKTELDLADPGFRDRFYRSEGNTPQVHELQQYEEFMSFAELAYETSVTQLQVKLRAIDYNLVRFDMATEPGRVGHFVISHTDKKRVIIGIKGTSTFSDILTDLVGLTVQQELNGQQVNCHEGMYTAAKMLFDDTLPLVEQFFIPAGYSIVVTGHSLGAGVACLLGMLLTTAIPSLRQSNKLRVYAYATPACLSMEACQSCTDYITSVVNNTDCVPRLGVPAMRVLHRLFLQTEVQLKKKGLNPSDLRMAQKYVSDLMVVDKDLLITPEEFMVFYRRILEEERPFCKASFAIFVPGRVVCMWECSEGDSLSVDARCGTGSLGTMRSLDLSTSMVGDHGTTNYKKNLRTLVVEAQNNSKFVG